MGHRPTSNAYGVSAVATAEQTQEVYTHKKRSAAPGTLTTTGLEGGRCAEIDYFLKTSEIAPVLEADSNEITPPGAREIKPVLDPTDLMMARMNKPVLDKDGLPPLYKPGKKAKSAIAKA